MKGLGKNINPYTLIAISLLALTVFVISIFHGRPFITNQDKGVIGKPEIFVKNIPRPIGMTLGKNGNIFIQCSYDGKIFATNNDGKLFDYAYLDNYQGYGIDVDRNGNFIMAGGERVVKVNSAGKEMWSFDGFNYAYDIELAPDGTIFVSDSVDNIIYKISPQGAFSKLLTLEGRKADSERNAAGIRLDKEANILYAVNMYTGDLFRIKLTEDYQVQKSEIVASGLKKPNFIDIDEEGNVYITCLGDNSIARVDQNSIVETIDTEGKLSTPSGILFVEGQNDSGNLYVASHDTNSIYKINIGIKNKNPTHQ